VLYVSTDWDYELISKAMAAFSLSKYGERIADPYTMRKPADYAYLSDTPARSRPGNLELQHLNPENRAYDTDFSSFLERGLAGSHRKQIGVLDLKSNTSGDDWNHVLRLGTLLPKLSRSDGLFIIVDAVEGIELLEGDADQFGRIRSRRQRIAQFARVAGQNHWALVIEDRGQSGDEQGTSTKHYDEEFISDVVLRVGVRQVAKYSERFVEVTKCRGSIHQLGKHPMLLRDGSGSRGSIGWHADDPRIPNPIGTGTQSYAYVIPSIHSRAAALLAGRKEVSR
jgi:hypothetical protein